MTQIMARNDAKEYMQEQANRYYKGELSWDDYKGIKIEFIPLDLTGYPAIKPETAKWLNILFDEETTDRKGNYMLRGFTYRSAQEKEALGCTYGDAGCDSVSYYAYNDAEQLIYTYCEGDTTCTLFSDKEKYLEEKAEAARWYREER